MSEWGSERGEHINKKSKVVIKPSLHLFTKNKNKKRQRCGNKWFGTVETSTQRLFPLGTKTSCLLKKTQKQWDHNRRSWTRGRDTLFHLVSRPAAQPPLPLELELLVFLGTSSGVLWLSLPLLLLHDEAEKKNSESWWDDDHDDQFTTEPSITIQRKVLCGKASKVKMHLRAHAWMYVDMSTGLQNN